MVHKRKFHTGVEYAAEMYTVARMVVFKGM